MFFLSILTWVFFGLVVGLIAKAIHPGEEPIGFLPTLATGVAGSYLGGILNWFFYGGQDSFLKPSGVFMSIVGGIFYCMLWRLYDLKNANRSFFTGKKIN